MKETNVAFVVQDLEHGRGVIRAHVTDGPPEFRIIEDAPTDTWSIEAALAWSRSRADVVLLRTASSRTYYSVGAVIAPARYAAPVWSGDDAELAHALEEEIRRARRRRSENV